MINQEVSNLFLVATTPEYYTIPISPVEVTYLQKQLGTRERIVRFVSMEDGRPVIKLEKKYGYLNKETFANEEAQQLNLRARALYSAFASRLTKDDRFTADEVQEIVGSFDADNKLDQYEKALLEKILETTLEKFTVLDTVTDFITSRLCDEWTKLDTESLPSGLIKQFQFFIEQEQCGWVDSSVITEGDGLGKNS